MDADLDAIAAIRGFNRFHTRWVGAVGGSLHGSGLALSEARVLYELAQRDAVLASVLARELDLDPAYLSRILTRFLQAGWLTRETAPLDRRARLLRLTPAGHAAFRPLDQASQRQAAAALARLAPGEKRELVQALGRVQALLGDGEARRDPSPPIIRRHRPGDIGWIIASHARFYAAEFGWDASFEVLVAEIAGAFLRDFKPGLEAGFIAEWHGEPVGSSIVVREDEETARLRLVLVDKRAQGLGLGKRLVREAIAFARSAGYRRMVLWTNDILHAARAIYQAEGFRLVAEERHQSFGQDLVGQSWQLDLRSLTP